jgi:hypothetical protein
LSNDIALLYSAPKAITEQPKEQSKNCYYH